MADTVRRQDYGRVVELRLARSQAGNAFDSQIVEDLLHELDRIDAHACDTIVFRGEGKGFCGGLDLSEMETETDATFLARLVRIELLLQIDEMPEFGVDQFDVRDDLPGPGQQLVGAETGKGGTAGDVQHVSVSIRLGVRRWPPGRRT